MRKKLPGIAVLLVATIPNGIVIWFGAQRLFPQPLSQADIEAEAVSCARSNWLQGNPTSIVSKQMTLVEFNVRLDPFSQDTADPATPVWLVIIKGDFAVAGPPAPDGKSIVTKYDNGWVLLSTDGRVIGRGNQEAGHELDRNAPSPSRTPGIPENSAAEFVPPPKNLIELEQSAQVIVIGALARLVHEGDFWGYDGAAPARPRAGLFAALDYEIAVETVFKDDGRLAAGKPLILRVLDGPDPRNHDTKVLPPLGARRMFYLMPAPDGQTYGITSFLDILIIDGPEVRYAIRDKEYLLFEQPITPQAFLKQLKAITSQEEATLSP